MCGGLGAKQQLFVVVVWEPKTTICAVVWGPNHNYFCVVVFWSQTTTMFVVTEETLVNIMLSDELINVKLAVKVPTFADPSVFKSKFSMVSGYALMILLRSTIIAIIFIIFVNKAH